MKTTLPILFLLVASLLVSCAGTAARQSALLPAIASSWSAVRVQVTRELAAAPDPAGTAAVFDADAALAKGDPVAIAAVPWSLLEGLALADVQRREAAAEIGPGVAKILRGRLADLAESRSLYLRRTQ
ncbi:MAG: hypothetical protein JNK15_03185 [Planctomycetes bacterium]|nr:hypothetical protein [Planctomycetota bacterium]